MSTSQSHSLNDLYEADVLDFVAACIQRGESEQSIIAALRQHEFSKTEARQIIRGILVERNLSLAESTGVAEDAFPMEVKYCRSKMFAMLLMLLMTPILFSIGGRSMSMLTALLAGAMGLIVIARMLRNTPLYTLDRSGLFVHASNKLYRWSDFKGAICSRYLLNQTITAKLKCPGRQEESLALDVSLIDQPVGTMLAMINGKGRV